MSGDMTMDQMPASERSRGRHGRPFERLKARLKREGTNICWRCGKPIDLRLNQYNGRGMDWTLDHYVPTSVGGLGVPPIEDVREAHRSCNSSRGNGVTRGKKEKPKGTRIW